MNPILQALKALGGSATIEELNAKVIELAGLTDDQLEIIHDAERGSQTEVEYRLAWARTYLKKYGLIENSSRGVWSLTLKGKETDQVNPQAVKRYMNEQQKKAKAEPEKDELDTVNGTLTWRDELMNVLLKLEPAAFERLVQRLLRESGFIQVEVTGRSGDGGIDGVGVLRLNLLSLHVLFQCKKWKSSVGAAVVRDFRGAMVGRADKGLIITTGNFTADARREATRDGAPAIDLVDGDALCELLKTSKIGVSVALIEKVVVDGAAFASI